MLFRFENIYKSYGAYDVLRGVTCQVNPQEKVGLVGSNGAGKSTLFKLLCHTETPDEGQVVRASDLSIGLLEQHPHFQEDLTVVEAARNVFSHLQKMETEIEELEHQMADYSQEGDSLTPILEKYSELQHSYEEAGGFTYQARVESVLQGLSFKKSDFDLLVNNLSGGQQGRLHLAMLLLRGPDVLLLDEPTNHLDLTAVEWLEEFLLSYKSAYVIISHDRFLLDRVTTRTIELDKGTTTSYFGSFSEYLIKRDAEREIQQRHYEKQQEDIARTEEFIRRNLAGQKTKQAKSRRKQLEKLDRLEAGITNVASSNFKLKSVVRTGDQVLTVDQLCVGYENKSIAGPFDFTIARGERLGILGPNGVGKTTLFKTILGDLTSISGEIRWGTGVQLGYYDQRLEKLTLANTVMSELQSENLAATERELRSFLARFLFRSEDVFKVISSLSGGERGRLALAKLIYSKSNVLILDEPTNHLDIASCEALEQALNEYSGTCLMISHDRYFLDRICTRLLYLEPGKYELFDGSYTELREKHQREQSTSSSSSEASSNKSVNLKKQTSSNSSNKIKKEKNRSMVEIENEISSTEENVRIFSEQMANPEFFSDPVKLSQLQSKYTETSTRLEELYEEWNGASATLR